MLPSSSGFPASERLDEHRSRILKIYHDSAGIRALSALQVIEFHLQGEEHERRLAFDLQQRVFVHANPEHFWPFYPDEISSAPL